MPTFELSGPDGGTYQIDAPDENAALSAFQTHMGGAPKPAADSRPSSSMSGVAKSLGSGLAEGVIGLAGLPGDLYHMGLRALGDNLTPESRFGSDSIKKSVEGYTGEFYKPQGTAEELANKVGIFAPSVMGGPETMAAKVATRVAAPAVASEIGGKVAGPYGEVAGALTGAAGATAAANKFRAMGAARNAGAAQPTIEEMKAASRAGYQSPEVAAVQIRPQAVDTLATAIENDLVSSGFRQRGQANVFDIVDELKNAPGAVGVADLDSARKALGVIAKEKDAVGAPTANAVAAQKAVRHIDDFLPNLNQADLLAGDAQRANSILGEARQNWGAAKRAEQVKTTLANAELSAAAANSGQNIQNSIRQAFKPLLRNNGAKAVGYSDEELKALNRVVRGDALGGAARFAGNLLGGGGGLGMLASGAVGYEAGGPAGAIAAGLAGKGFKAVGNSATYRAVRDLDRLIRSRSPLALSVAQSLPPQVVALLPRQSAAMLAALSAQPVLQQPAYNQR